MTQSGHSGNAITYVKLSIVVAAEGAPMSSSLVQLIGDWELAHGTGAVSADRGWSRSFGRGCCDNYRASAPLAEDHTCYRSCGFGRGRGSFRVSLHFESHHAYRCRRLIGR